MPSETSPLLSIVLPTYNERENIAPVVGKILEVLWDIPSEVIVVDDGSPDGTAAVVRELGLADARVRLVERSGKIGLSSAVFAGAEAASGRFVAVMDADMSHDPEELPDMFAKAGAGYDIVIGSRFVPGAGFVGQPLARRLISYALNLVVRTLFLLGPRDVLTGYALTRREVITEMPTRYSAGGFKWLLEVLATQRGLRVYEWPMIFHDRNAGASKATAKEVFALQGLCLRIIAWRIRHLLRRAQR